MRSLKILILSLFISLAFANPNGNNLNFYYQNQTLNQALQMYANANNLTLTIDRVNLPQLKQVVSGHFQVESKTDLLNVLGHEYGFSWFIFNSKLYIADNNFISKTVQVAPEDMPSLKDNLVSQKLLDTRFGYSEIPAENKVIISGPAAYVNLLIDQVHKLNIAPSSKQFAIFRLKYASATDITINLNNQTGLISTNQNQPVITIPGVASMLSALVQSNTQSTTKQTVLSQISQPIKNSAQAILEDNKAKTGGVNTVPNIQADQRLNAIIIRDNSANIAMYRNLINLLDVSTPLVQVSVTILTVDQDALTSKGINWWASNGNVGGGYNTAGGVTNALTKNLALYYGQIAPGQVLVNTIGNFVLAINFLSQNGITKVDAKPSLVTSDNIPAVISSNQSLYLNNGYNNNNSNGGGSNSNNSMVGYQAMQLATSLVITPHVIYQGGRKTIKLQINIMDGNVTDEIATNLPTSIPSSIQSDINSQAVIDEGQSLLIAGYSKTKTEEIVSKVPLLGDIPLLGYFFSWHTNRKRKIETLYLVTPKIVWSGVASSK